jgi:hypothetical protein
VGKVGRGGIRGAGPGQRKRGCNEGRSRAKNCERLGRGRGRGGEERGKELNRIEGGTRL